MSDGCSDALDYFHALFNKFLTSLSDYHKFRFQESTKNLRSYIFALEILREQFQIIPDSFFSELKLTKNMALLVMNFRDDFYIPTLEQTMYLLLSQNRLLELSGLQHSSRYNNQLLIFVGENGQVMPNGVQYQNAFWQFLDGDQDILLGIAKKRCCNDPFAGQPVILVAEKHRYRKNSFILKEVVRL